MDVDLDDLQESVINPLVDFSVDFVGNFDPNCLLKVDVEKMLQTGVDVQDHQAIQSFYEKKKNENEKLRTESSSRFPSIDVNSMLDSTETMSVKRRDRWVINIFNSWCNDKIKSKEIHQIPVLECFSDEDINNLLSKFILEVRKKDGTYYPRESLIVIAAGLQNIIRKKRPGINLFNAVETALFTKSLDAAMKVSTASLPPKNSTNHKPISVFDEEEIFSSNVFSAETV